MINTQSIENLKAFNRANATKQRRLLALSSLRLETMRSLNTWLLDPNDSRCKQIPIRKQQIKRFSRKLISALGPSVEVVRLYRTQYAFAKERARSSPWCKFLNSLARSEYRLVFERFNSRKITRQARANRITTMQRHLALLEERIVSHVVPLKPEAEFLGSYDSVSSLEAHIDQLIWFQMNGDITRSEFSEFATIINAKTGVSFGLEQLLEEKIKAHDATRPRPGSVQELFEEMLKKHEENEAKRPHPEKVNTPIYWMRAYTTMSAGHAGSTTE